MSDISRNVNVFSVGNVTRSEGSFDKNPNYQGSDDDNNLYTIKASIEGARDKRYAFWQAFESSVRSEGYGYDSWKGTLQKGIRVYSPESLLARFEDALTLMSPLSDSQFKRRMGELSSSISFNPVRQYLEGLAQKAKEGHILNFAEWMEANNAYGSDRSEFEAYRVAAYDNASRSPIEAWKGWDTLAKDVFGVEDELSQEMFTSWLIGAVARAVDPGCQMRQCLVLQGKQEIGKTQVLKALAGDYYSSRDSEMSDADVYRQLQGAWIMELEEIEAIATKRSVENLKRFISVQEDEYRALYEDQMKKHPRHAVMAATANSSEFLRDSTGNSRFWVISIPDEINVEYVRQVRDRLWLEAYRRYLNGEKPWTKDLSDRAQEHAKKYQMTNEFTDILEPIVKRLVASHSTPVAFKGSDLLTNALGISVSSHAKFQKKLGSAMAELGYVNDKVMVEGERVRAYHLPGTKPYLVNAEQVFSAKSQVASGQG